MGVRILEGVCINESIDKTGAVFYCGTTMRPFGPMFDSGDEAQNFLDYCEDGCKFGDIRRLTQVQLDTAVIKWRARL